MKYKRTNNSTNLNPELTLPSMYTTDGVLGSNLTYFAGEKLEQCECCQRFYRQHAFEHQNKGYCIDGINTCIHCYIGLNLEKYGNKTSNHDESNQLYDYLREYSKEHNSKVCHNLKTYGRCLLCEHLSSIKNAMKNTTNDNDKNSNNQCDANFVNDDKIIVNHYKKPNFTLQI